jgi:hypothetical protein
MQAAATIPASNDEANCKNLFMILHRAGMRNVNFDFQD